MTIKLLGQLNDHTLMECLSNATAGNKDKDKALNFALQANFMTIGHLHEQDCAVSIELGNTPPGI